MTGLKVNTILVIIGGVLLTVSIVLAGMFALGGLLTTCRDGYSLVEDPPICRANSEIIQADFPECFLEEHLSGIIAQGLSYTSCNQEEVNLWEDAYWTRVAPIPICDLEEPEVVPLEEWARLRVVDVGGIRFWLESDSFPNPDHDGSHCTYDARIRIHGSLREEISFEFVFENFSDRPSGRYDVTLLLPREDRRVAGLVYDREAGELTYFSTEWNL